MSAAESRQALVADLRRDLSRLEKGRLSRDERLFSTGSSALDSLLPGGGLRPGSLVEYLSLSSASGAGTLALAAAHHACQGGRALVVIDHPAGQGRQAGSGRRTGPAPRDNIAARAYLPRTRPPSDGSLFSITAPATSSDHFYPPAAAAWGIDLARLLVLRPTHEADALWALDQALRCPGVGAVWARWNEFDPRDFRRLQLAAEEGGTLGLLLRPASRRGCPTWAYVQWLVTPFAPSHNPRQKFRSSTFDLRPTTWKLHVELTRCQGATGGGSMLLEFDESTGHWQESTHATNTLPAPAQLAHPAPARRA